MLIVTINFTHKIKRYLIYINRNRFQFVQFTWNIIVPSRILKVERDSRTETFASHEIQFSCESCFDPGLLRGTQHKHAHKFVEMFHG